MSRAVLQKHVLRAVALLALCSVALQVIFAARIALMAWVDPQSTTFQRSEAWRLLAEKHALAWRQEWVGYGQISEFLKRAVVASEDSAFVDHSGVDWEALDLAWSKNQRAQARAESTLSTSGKRAGARRAMPKVVGGSTITQQLAKNLLLSGERTGPRKAQELLITLMLEGLLTKERILEIYLNHVEWGEGVFGAQAAARHYYRTDAALLGAEQAARLAVMLPAPKRFEKQPASAYVSGRAMTIAARMGSVELP